MSTEYAIRTFAYGSPDYKKALQLRTVVLREPLGLVFTDEELKKDEHDVHFGLFSGDKILACLILTETENERMKMRQVAVDSSHQSAGLGKALSLAAEKYAFQKGFKTMYCHARKTATPFYLKLGYHIVGDEFTEVNIPHYTMEKKIG
jgi:predicted GNAT family N-acyltransferase